MTQAQDSMGGKKTEMSFNVWGCHHVTALGNVPAHRDLDRDVTVENYRSLLFVG